MKIKKILLSLIVAVMVLLPLTVKAEGKVKVYIFEAGGCPYCEAEIEYLESLDGYGEKFEIVRKELYIDHVDWEQGKDYELGVNVANAFYSAGFENATYTGTPFVVISDLYAAATYSQNLESVIDTAYAQGDKDVVGCFEAGGTDCLEGAAPETYETKEESNDTVTLIILGVVVVGIGLLIFLARKSSKEEERLDRAFAIDVDEEDEPVKKETKKAPVVKAKSKTTTKATNEKKTSTKSKKPATKKTTKKK